MARGGNLEAKRPDDKPPTLHTTMPQALIFFKGAARQVIRDNHNPLLAKFFAPAANGLQRLQPIGYTNHMAAIACYTAPSERLAVTKFPLSFRMKMTL